MLRKLFTNNIDNIKHIWYTTFVNAIRTNAINNIQELKEFGFNLQEDINNAPFEDNAFQARLQPILLNLRLNAQQDIEPEIKLKLELEGLYERLYNEIVLSVNEEVLYDKITELSQNGSDVNINDLFEDLDSKLQMPSMVNTTQTTFSNKNVTAPNKSSLFGNKLTKSLARSFSTVEKEKLVPNATIIKKTPKISIGGDFKDLVTKSDVFVDKSLFIKEILEDPAEAILITMPRRWGKSLNLDMLKRFLSVQVDSEGNTINREETDNYKLFAGGEIEVQDGFKKNQKNISVSKLVQQNPNATEIQSQYPVISIDFKDCKGSDVNEIKGTLQSKLYKTVAKFSYLKNSEKEYEFSTIKDAYLKLAEDIKSGTLMHSLKELSALLHAHHGKKVWILIDEYDAAANKAYLEFSEADAKSVSELFRSIYEPALKGNEHLEKGVMTGVQYIVKSGMLSGLNNLSKYNVTDTVYSQYYGINQEEMDYLLTSFDISSKKDDQGEYTDNIAQKIKEWYNGYKERDMNTPDQYIEKYNIWSVTQQLNALSNSEYAKFKSYWENSGNVKDLIQKALKNKDIQKEIIELSLGGKFLLPNPTVDFNTTDFTNLKEITNSGINEATASGQKLLFSYLFITGYFTSNNESFFFPNKEIIHEMNNYITEFFETKYNISTESIADTIKTVSSVFDTTNTKSIKGIFEDSLGSKFQTIIQRTKEQKDDNEDIVHSLLNYIIRQVPDAKSGTETDVQKQFDGKLKYKIIDTKEFVYKNQDEDNFYKLEYEKLESTEGINTNSIKAAKGRADVWISKNGIGLILEMKFHKSSPTNEEAKEQADAALKQAKEYAELIRDPFKIFIGCNVTDQQEVFISGSIEKEGQDAITFEYPPSC